MPAVATANRRKLRPFTVKHFRDWAKQHTLDNEEPWEVEDFFEEFVTDVFAGIPICWLVVPEENSKTTGVAGLALYHSEFQPSAYVPVAASSRDQAEWIYRQAEGFVFRSDRQDTFKCLEGYRRIRCDGMGSRIQVFAADDRSGDGIIPTLAILDELHRHRDLALYRTWVGKLRKRRAQLLVASTAGEVGGEFEAERQLLRQSGTEISRTGCFIRSLKLLDEKPLSVIHDWSLPEESDVDDLKLVKAANPFSGITLESLREKREMTSSLQHWSRFTCNRATRTSLAAITEAEWHGAESDIEIPEGEGIWAGLDLGWKWDTTALVPLWIRDAEFRLFGPATVLEPPRDGSSLDPVLVEGALLKLHGRNPIHTVVMDMSKGEQLASWIESEIGAVVIDRTQSNPMAALDYARFMEALRKGWLYHSGDPGLTQHALNAIARQLPGGDVRFDRQHDSRRGSAAQHAVRVIDALSAASMVHTTAAAELLDPARPSVPMVAVR